MGTKNLTEGVVMIIDETDTIYAAYNDIFTSGKYDWQWVKDFTSQIYLGFNSIVAFKGFKAPNFDDGESELELFSDEQPPDYSSLGVYTKPYGPISNPGSIL